ncbi:MAG: adenosylhomocysteinase [Symbiobacteriaceae bacterium]|nr:adenosylhomocysteinase [Symbiobacteriaceae bacterium]
MSIIRDISLAPAGKQKIAWVDSYMPLLNLLEKELYEVQPFKGRRATLSIHLEAKTARLVLALHRLGAEIQVTGSNPLSTQDDVAAALAAEGIPVFAWYGATSEEYFSHLRAALAHGPQIVLDDGADLAFLLHTELKELAKKVIGGTEETTTGVQRLRALHQEGTLLYPVISVNDAKCKYLFDNRYGTGQSAWDGINRTTNLIVAGKAVVIAGYGWVGRGLAMRAAGQGARVIVTEIDPVKAIEARMDGYEVMPMDLAASQGDIFVTCTGCKDVIIGRHFKQMRDGAILCNAGHFDVEVNIPDLEALAVECVERRRNITGYRLADGRWLNLLAAGRLVNLASGDGHPAEIMDLSFALQLLSAVYLVQQEGALKVGVYDVPAEIDTRIARLKLQSWGTSVDILTAEQQAYINSWTL